MKLQMTKMEKEHKEIFRLSLYGELKVLLGTHFPKKFSVFVIRRFEWHIGGYFPKKISKNFSHHLLENKMAFGPLLKKKLIFSLLIPWLDIFVGFGPLFEKTYK